MPDVSPESSVEQQAVNALGYLDDKSKQKVLEYIDSLVTLDKANNDERNSQ